MVSKVFINFQRPAIDADWLNDVNNFVYSGAGVSSQSLATTSGAAAVGFDWAGLYSGQTAGWGMQSGANSISILRFLPPAQWAAILDGTSTYDVAPAVASAVNGAGPDTDFFFPGKLYCLGASGVDIISKTGVVLHGNATFKALAQSALTIMTLGRAGIRFSSCTRSGIRGLKFNLNGIAQIGVGFVSCTEYFADRCEAYNGLGIALMASVAGLRGKWTGNICRDPAVGGATRGIWIGNISAPEMEADVFILGNHCLRNSATGIVVTSVGGEVVGNRACDNNGSGIIFPGANGFAAKNIAASGNTCNNNTFHGFQSDIVYTSDADLSQDIALTGNTCNGNYNSGIYAINSRGWTVVGNTCLNNNSDGVGTGYGIQADDRSYDITIAANNCSDTRSGAARTQSGGIRATSQAFSGRNISIVGNMCKNNLVDGIIATVASGLTMTGLSVLNNNCSGNGSRGMLFTETTAGSMSLVLNGNTCLGNTTQDIRVSILDANIGLNRYITQQDVQFRDFDALASTPSVMGRPVWRANNASATTITNFLDSVDGASISVRGANANTTLQNNANIILKGATNAVLPTDGYITFRRESSVWKEVSRSF